MANGELFIRLNEKYWGNDRRWTKMQSMRSVNLTTNFHFAVRLFNDHRWRENVVRAVGGNFSTIFLSYFVVFCDLLLNRRTAT